VETYLLAVDDLPEGQHKAQVQAITSPVLDALDTAYSTPCEGTGIFPLQAMQALRHRHWLFATPRFVSRLCGLW
jgi:hypothetical protein